MTEPRITAVSAGLSVPSSTRLLADRLTGAAGRALRERGAAPAAETVELRDHAHALTDNLLTGFPSGDLKAAVDAASRADGLIAVTPIFNASYSGLFKTFFDVLEEGALQGTPVLIAATGGTPRHSLALEHALRPMFAHLRAVTVPTAVYAASEDWGAGGAAHGGLASRIDRAAGEFADLVAGRPAAARPDPYEEPVPFERLLAGE
ncbi:FMN reductase [Nocardiopsis sp. CNT-189]|uniref:FMN reductase n=1 Tax=Nocardiopsis oceanisediminis TaxID=2816862 RepID=UPI003B2B722E